MVSAKSSCVVTPDQEEGPYYRELVLLRDDITEGRPGSPLRLEVVVLDESCRPVEGARVDLWHCDALGAYSWYAAAEEEDSAGPAMLQPGTFLRGSQRCDQDGRCGFRTIYPGWYPGRAVHIHGKVHHPRGVLTVQLYFPEALTDRVHDAAPYASRSRRDTTIGTDTIFPSGGGSTLLAPTRDEGGHAAEAVLVVG